MRPFQRKNRLQRLIRSVAGTLGLRKGVTSNLPSVESPKVKSGLAAAGGVAGLTAASAAVSAVRRRKKEPETHS